MRKIFTLSFCLLISSLSLCQVGINTIEPNSNALLHISEKMKKTDPDSNNKLKGMIIPRLTQQERDKLTYSDAPTNSTFRLNNADNSLIVFNTTENCFNFWNIDDKEWKSICGNLGNAKFTFDCSNVSLKGAYVKGKEVDGTDYISIKINSITKAGAYLITATSDPDNGYSFVGEGTFTTKDSQTVRLYAQGTPVTAQKDNFTISSSGNSAQDLCSVEVNVQPDIAGYSLNCSSIVVNGNYIKGTALTSSNNITMSVRVNSLGSYNVSTPVVSGISFSASGVFTQTGIQQITLSGTGTPTENSNITLTTTSNTIDGNSTCSATVPVMLPPMTYGLIGTDGTYGWTGIRGTGLTNGASFGPNGIVKIKSLTQAWGNNGGTTAVSAINNNPPDIIMYNAYGASNSNDLIQALKNYVQKGGILIYASTSDSNGLSDTQNLLNGIFGLPSSAVSWQTSCSVNCPSSYPNDDNDYLINNLSNDPIINGPFGNVSGKYWGEDNQTTGTIVLKSLPSGSVQVAPANNNWGHSNVNPDYSTVWYSHSSNFFMFGDTVGVANQNNTDVGGYPAIYSSSGVPMSKQYGNGDNSGSPYVYNAILEMNAVSWALKKAAVSGINPH